jgi:hypothetical protein
MKRGKKNEKKRKEKERKATEKKKKKTYVTTYLKAAGNPVPSGSTLTRACACMWAKAWA